MDILLRRSGEQDETMPLQGMHESEDLEVIIRHESNIRHMTHSDPNIHENLSLECVKFGRHNLSMNICIYMTCILTDRKSSDMDTDKRL